MFEKKSVTRQEIEEKLKSVGDYVKMDYLQRSLKSNLDFETKKFVQLKLSKIYESRNMFSEAARMIKNAADINTTFKGKIQDYMKSADLFVKAGSFEEAEDVFKRALACGNNSEKMEIKGDYKRLFSAQAEAYLRQDKRNQARKTFERFLNMELDVGERAETQRKLLDLYQKLGLIREYTSLKKSM